MVRTSLVLFVLLILGSVAPASARSYVSRGYVPHDGWFRGVPSYHGFANRDPKIQCTDARRPDFSQWSQFDEVELRLKYPLYRDPEHPVHRVATPAGTAYVWPNRTDVQLSAAGVPPIAELCCHRCGKQHCKRHGKCGKRKGCKSRSCRNDNPCASCVTELTPPAAVKPEMTADCAEFKHPEGD